MGTKTSVLVDQPKQAEMSDMRQGFKPQSLNRQELEIYSICCIEVRRVYKEIWKSNFEQNCQQLRQDYRWIANIEKAYKTASALSRTVYYAEVHQLRNEFGKRAVRSVKSMVPPPVPHNTEIKEMLKKSVVFIEEITDKSRPRPRTSLRTSRNVGNRETIKISSKVNVSPINRMSGVTVIDENMKGLFTVPETKETLCISQAEIQSAESLILFVSFTEIIEKHCDDPYNTLCMIKEAFVEYIHTQYGKMKIVTDKEMEMLTRDVRQFVKLLKVTIYDYYKMELMEDIFPNQNLFSENNVINAVTSILFKDSCLYKVIYNIYEKVESNREAIILKAMLASKNCRPEQFGVKDQYCLNERTLEWAKEKQKLDPSYNLKSSIYPYEKSISKLRQIEDVRTPISKLKVIVGCADKITRSINQFYKTHNILSKHSMIDADQVLSIYTYVLCMSRIKNIETHLQIIENFSNEEQLLSITGYYFSVLLCSVENVINKDESTRKLDQTRRSLNTSRTDAFGQM